MTINTVNKSKLRTLRGWEAQTENLNNIINISCKFYLQKSLDIYILHKFSCGHNETANISFDMKRIAYIRAI